MNKPSDRKSRLPEAHELTITSDGDESFDLTVWEGEVANIGLDESNRINQRAMKKFMAKVREVVSWAGNLEKEVCYFRGRVLEEAANKPRNRY